LPAGLRRSVVWCPVNETEAEAEADSTQNERI
jgi:hypothetical protein